MNITRGKTSVPLKSHRKFRDWKRQKTFKVYYKI